MEYRLPLENEHIKIAALLKRKGYVDIHPASMGGHWLVAVKDGYIHGCIWFFAEAPNAYVDYLACDFPRTAATLCFACMRVLQNHGVRYVRGVVLTENRAAKRFFTEGFGMLNHTGYDLLFKELENGRISRRRTNPNTNYDHTRGQRPGNSPSKIIVPAR